MLKNLLMAGFEPGSSGDISNHSANCATTTAQGMKLCVSIIIVKHP